MINLVYPTIYREVIQRFAVNGDIYWENGLPGHDGLDFKVPFHAKIYAAADGIVSKVNFDLHERFGLSIVLQHDNGYSTLYGYLGKVNVSEGDEISQNDVIGLAGDATNRGYFHFGLYNPTLERLKHSEYPNGELDPTPFLKYDKANYISKNIVSLSKSAVLGLNHEKNKTPELIRSNENHYAFSHHVGTKTIESCHKDSFILIVVDEKFSSSHIKPSVYLKTIRSDIERVYKLGNRYFQIGKSPNITKNGMHSAWRSPGDFARWWIDVCSPLKELFPDIRIGYPSLTQGKAIPGIKYNSKQFLLESGDALDFADWVGFEYIWQSRNELMSLMEANELATVAKITPEKSRIITGYGQIAYLLSKNKQRQNYDEFESWIKNNDLADYLFKIVV